MGKQKKILTEIIKQFQFYLVSDSIGNDRLKAKMKIWELFHNLLNKSDLVRKILNDVVLRNDEILRLLRICFKKESEFKK